MLHPVGTLGRPRERLLSWGVDAVWPTNTVAGGLSQSHGEL